MSQNHARTRVYVLKNGLWSTPHFSGLTVVPAPIYYSIVFCGNNMKLAWHFWYGQQKGCDPFGVDEGHGDDWEHITINFAKNASGDDWVQDSVTWFQHSG